MKFEIAGDRHLALLSDIYLISSPFTNMFNYKLEIDRNCL
jgi:hypothetical protein